MCEKDPILTSTQCLLRLADVEVEKYKKISHFLAKELISFIVEEGCEFCLLDKICPKDEASLPCQDIDQFIEALP